MPVCPECDKELPTERGLNSHIAQVHSQPWHDADKLRELYWDEGLSLSQIAERLGCATMTVHNQMEWNDIPRRDLEDANASGEDHHFWNGGKITVECDWCGSELERFPGYVENFETQFCDSSCRAAYVSEHYSGKDAWQYNGERKTVSCDHCGETIERRQSHIDNTERNFCDRACYHGWRSEHIRGPAHPRWTGGQLGYGTGWHDGKKEAVRERDDHTCQGCGRTQAENLEREGRKLTVHHIQKARTFDDPEKRNAMENLVALCDDCHPVWERMSPLQPLT